MKTADRETSCRNRERIKDSSDPEMAELWTRPKVSHRLFRACQYMEGNSVSDWLSGTALYDTAIAAKRVSSCSYCAESLGSL